MTSTIAYENTKYSKNKIAIKREDHGMASALNFYVNDKLVHEISELSGEEIPVFYGKQIGFYNSGRNDLHVEYLLVENTE